MHPSLAVHPSEEGAEHLPHGHPQADGFERERQAACEHDEAGELGEQARGVDELGERETEQDREAEHGGGRAVDGYWRAVAVGARVRWWWCWHAPWHAPWDSGLWRAVGSSQHGTTQREVKQKGDLPWHDECPTLSKRVSDTVMWDARSDRCLMGNGM
ncbi:hypothetical protein BU26DRAFT_134736 [Trematosphaeria pertusa]|uniref:Uncharacterized protein n=1 Tax=Trematosphaeria pertusa TaxID=390896 RepID=A0A6A6IX34_9PLEO|nr:uncharacterized protein BU26DRAFT_134736 [Trematosphaeria pertusa]KAF2254180.1 hypothetical protein BU26DRAFT_134736 [Trematosphaeria pertusa]